MRLPHKPYRLLLVDDEPSLLYAMGDYLSWAGFEVDMAAGLHDAQAYLRGRKYAALVADLRLAGSDVKPGLQVIGMARALSSTTRIVLFTADPVSQIDARSHGADLVLHKPTPLPEVAECLVSLLEGVV